MNCFAHAFPFLDDAYFVVGSCIPDWLMGIDRKVRAREKSASKFVNDQDNQVAAIARGVVQHHQDDDWFHRSAAFGEISLQFAVELRDLFNERSMRPGLVGHIIVEVFLDAFLHRENPGRLDYFYQQIGRTDPRVVQETVNRFATKSTDKLTTWMEKFKSARYIYDYSTDEGTIFRLNRVLQSVGLKAMGDEVLAWTPSARQRVYSRASELLQYLG